MRQKVAIDAQTKGCLYEGVALQVMAKALVNATAARAIIVLQ